MAEVSINSASAHTIDDWILDNLHDYPKAGEHREEDKRQLGNALIAWAMLTASQIESELGWAPDRPPTPRNGDVLLWALDRLGKRVGA
jgi:hypothetical protein